ncbi:MULTISPECIES: CDP-diacylglycerol--glycerol-3-phosphate 3-phosphatidyltransferase [Gluconobacter]|uniref:CDP-diacylglycerol--glycerol-3-phosphate 3-phosphatidyltransferase n=1 Tax=Gluconobacter cerinus TaxID=38307 RepID=A0AAV5NCV0_9PROT|nr:MULTISPECIES: CDP-diacylglycerol--glycerol-3-phosphate 3-phosphatidyltransferase [Gluconobacter]MBS0983538.1 CDP-diacylglycerol--glycerol-3-phosphate 3-phosphatidyltransferase [Gluconobacter cerinus]MBS0994676.1 CDP-diacylglycerol--glycerol-3-phosphate 3-phosphatidyltransferase [Gluconobacter cerinus]MBS1019458.1 CDP-diacylglycerol--glycerol-3-phosphate 3-phosphatidyltransferase [Gluconobacter cerinus]MBS1021786.1 CDP-diacylglycerol--glycerol-3-phosphate 3-phosphatidyltransferase [Gluconobac
MLTDLPNVLTLLRIAAIPVLVALLALHSALGNVAACVVYTAACITDYLDGALARKWQMLSELGRMMDPIADKLLVGALLLALAGLTTLPVYSLYAAIIIMLREILVSGLREYMASQRATLPSTRLAKWKTGIQMVAIGFLIGGDKAAATLHLSFLPATLIGGILLWVSVIPTVLSGWGYLTAGLSRMMASEPRKSSKIVS